MATQRRSDIVRSRRSERTTTTPAQRRKSNGRTSMRQMPPMVSRSWNGEAAAPASKRRKPIRHRYNVALDTAGAELRLPPVAIPRIGARLLSGLLLAGLLVLCYWLWTSPMFTLTAETVSVTGLDRVSQEEFLDKADIIDKAIFLVSPAQLEADLLEMVPALEDITITVRFPAAVSIDVAERVPVIAWNQENINQIWWIDTQGVRFPAIGSSAGLVYVQAFAPPPPMPTPLPPEDEEQEEEETDVPEENPQLLSEEMVIAILTLSPHVPEGSTLVYDSKYGLGWEDPVYRWMVYFGKQPDRVNVRLAIYQAIADHFTDRSRKPVLISVEYLHAPYYRLKP